MVSLNHITHYTESMSGAVHRWGTGLSLRQSLDECAYHLSDATTFCNNAGVCEGYRSTTCEAAYAAQTRFELLPVRSEGTIYQALIMDEADRPPPPVGQAEAVELGEHLDYLSEYLESLHTPRVMYVDETHGERMRSVYSALMGIRGDECSYAGGMSENIMRMRFGNSVIAITKEVLRMHPKTYRNYLYNLIPYLHLWSTMQFKLRLSCNECEDFWVSNIQLMLTLSQFHPLYLEGDIHTILQQGALWRFHIQNPLKLPWEEYIWERPVLPLHPAVMSRAKMQMGDIGEPFFYNPDAQLPTLVEAFRRSLQTPPKRLTMKFTCNRAEYLAHLLYLVSLEDLNGHSADAVRDLCQAHTLISITGVLGELSLHHATTAHFSICKGLTSYHKRIQVMIDFTSTEPTRFSEYRAPNPPAFANADAAVAYIMSSPRIRVRDDLARVQHLWALDFLETHFIPRVSVTHQFDPVFANNPQNEPMLMAIGRLLAFQCWKGYYMSIITVLEERAFHNNKTASLDEILFLNSEFIKQGFYDLFSYDTLDMWFDPPNISSLCKEIHGELNRQRR